MVTSIVMVNGQMVRAGLPVRFRVWRRVMGFISSLRRTPFIIFTGNMGLFNSFNQYFRQTIDRKTKRRMFYAAKKKYTRCVTKHCKIPSNKVDKCGKHCKRQIDCVKKHCQKEDDLYTTTAFF